MIIENREETKDTRKRYKTKAFLVSSYLAEWRFSSKQLLASLLSQDVTSCSRFFKQLEAQKVIVPFANFNTAQRDLIRLGPYGATIFEGKDHDTTKHFLRNSRFEQHQNVVHDLLVQAACISACNGLPGIVEMISGYNIIEPGKVADAYLIDENQAVIAIEVERSNKAKSKIFFSYQRYKKMIDDGKIAVVAFYHTSEAARAYYEKLFREREWPIYELRGKEKNLELLQRGTLQVSASDPIRDRFKFVLLKSSKAPALEIKTRVMPEMGYRDRILLSQENEIKERQTLEREQKQKAEQEKIEEAALDAAEAAYEKKEADARVRNTEQIKTENEEQERKKKGLIGRFFQG